MSSLSKDHSRLSKYIQHNHGSDGIDRRGFLECMAWAGSGVLWTLAGGVLRSRAFGQTPEPSDGALQFLQISDTHIGFKGSANTDVTATLQAAIDKINALPSTPEFIIHTGDLSHNCKESEFDTLDQLLTGAHPKQVYYVPGEHDAIFEHGKLFLERYGRRMNAQGTGWYSFTHKDVHFIGLNNSAVLDGMGQLGEEQLQWLEADVKDQPSSRPVVIFAHIPLWSVYPEWGWATKDSEQALALLKRFGSVTVLNGHIHQVMQKVEGSVTFHTAMSTAFPQATPGEGKSPGPMKVPDEKLKSVLGITEVHSIGNDGNLAIVDATVA